MDDDLAPFESPRLYLDSAKRHIVNFESAAQVFIDNCTYTVSKKIDPNTGDVIIAGKLTQRFPPEDRKHASDAINDLRHALDQAICDAALELGGSDTKNVYFPFSNSRTEFPNAVKRKCKRVHPALLAFLESFAPYQGGDDELWILTRLAARKHRGIITVAPELDGVGLGPGVGGNITADFKLIGGSMSVNIRNEFQIAVMRAGTDYNFNIAPKFKIVFGKFDVVGHKAVLPYLTDIEGKVSTIIDGIEVETVRIKALPK